MSTQDFIDRINRHTQMPDPLSLEMGLDRLKQAKAMLGLTELRCPLIVVGGTNGKGSSVCFLEYTYRQAGYSVGSYTSPHLFDFNERIKINLQSVDYNVLSEAIDKIEARILPGFLSFFELTTLAAFLIFANHDLDVIIAEVGLGGRLDAVNAFDGDVALITSIDFDHQIYLGDTLEAIGAEKAGIMRAGRPVICAEPNPPQSLQQMAKQVGAQLYFSEPIDREVPIGRHNAGGVVLLIDLLQNRLPVPSPIIEQALNEVSAPARLWHVHYICDWVLDVAHNPAAMARLAEHLKARPITGRTFAIVGMCEDKDIQSSLQHLQHIVDQWHVAPFAHPRSATGEKLAHFIKAFSDKPCYNHRSIEQALIAVEPELVPNDRVVVFGSFFTIAETKRSDRWIAVTNNA